MEFTKQEIARAKYLILFIPDKQDGKDYWVVHGRFNENSIITEGDTLMEAWRNLSDALLATVKSIEKEVEDASLHSKRIKRGMGYHAQW